MTHFSEHDHGPARTDGSVWEEQYAGAERMWSGRVNQVLVDVVTGLVPGRALDVGCGEGADVLWLAEQGWQAEGIDVSGTAIDRARTAADAAQLTTARFQVGDIATWPDDQAGGYDLVIAFFLHDHHVSDRQGPLRRAAHMVAPRGRLLIVSHATMPPWAHHHDPDQEPITPEHDRDLLGVGDEWATDIAETRSRSATGPDGTRAVLEDSVLLLRRTR